MEWEGEEKEREREKMSDEKTGRRRKDYFGYLVEKDIFSIAPFSGKILQYTVARDSMFGAEIFPEFMSHYSGPKEKR